MSSRSRSSDRDELIVLQEFSDHFAADVAKSALDAAGIECFIKSDDAGGMRPGMWVGNGVQLVVRAQGARRAADVLKG
jgi:hypothetical protein